MSQIAVERVAPATEKSSVANLLVVLGFVATGAFVHWPYVLSEGEVLWNSEHYSFFPLALGVFVWLIWDRLQSARVHFSGQFRIPTLVVAALNLCIYGLAVISGSNWLGWVSFLMFLMTSAMLLLDAESFRLIRGLFLILVLIIPLPLNFDTMLVINLQKIATQQASKLLDYVGLYHAISGVTVQLPDKVFQIDDACSGIRSLFSGVTTMLVFAVYYRYGLLRVALTVLQTALWVLIINTLRVFLVVYAYDHWNAGLESGWKHEALGFVSYAVMILFALSTDQALRYVFPLSSGRGKLIDEEERVTLGDSLRRWLASPFSKTVSLGLVSLFAVGFIGLGVKANLDSSRLPTATNNQLFSEKLSLEVGEQVLPETIGGWKRTKFEAVNRDKHDLFGSNSMIWTYTRNGVVAQFSIDGAYPSFHDLWYCYSSTGWELRESSNQQLSLAATPDQQEVATEYQLYRGADEDAYVIYSCVDSTGATVEPPPPAESALRRLLNRLKSGNLLSEEGGQKVVPPVIQFQLFSRDESILFAQDVDDLRNLFSEARFHAKQALASSAQ
ncbi:MAG: exosortase U [Planctomycetaceae bacterium]|nr:exosortase U [Planctomycetaceae bacterium]